MTSFPRKMVCLGTVTSITNLRAEAELDLIHEDEPVGRHRLGPVQHHAALHLVHHLIHHLPRDVVSPRCGKKKNHMVKSVQKEERVGVQPWTARSSRSPTCRLGPGEDEGAGAAAAHHLVAGVEVDAVDGEGPQQGDLHGLGRHLVL